MGGERTTARSARSAHGGVDSGEQRASFGDRLQRAVHAIAGDRRQLRSFQASPAAFLRRHHIDARDPQGAQALAALESLLAAGSHADPSGEAHAHDAVVVSSSSIHGDGLFAHEGLGGGTVVCDVGVGQQVSYTASKVNQSSSPNTEMVSNGGNVILRTVRDVQPGEELVATYPLVDPSVKSQIPPPRSG
ncbi:MAG: SET domain-containing protein-lysine N-methyltransferase [Deltaproteobacteria bacterium]|nr:SET domain-containing protein-lysine N-methyltransferase [Deltaproteobacteria bacterium]